MSKESMGNAPPKTPRPTGAPPSEGYQPCEPLTGAPPLKDSVSGVRARPTGTPVDRGVASGGGGVVVDDYVNVLSVPLTLPRVARALELIALAQWKDSGCGMEARKVARRILEAWEDAG